jgi:hypothetical protein
MTSLETELAEARLLLKVISESTLRLTRYKKDLTDGERALLERENRGHGKNARLCRDARGGNGSIR